MRSLGRQEGRSSRWIGLYYDRISTRYANTPAFQLPVLCYRVGLVKSRSRSASSSVQIRIEPVHSTSAPSSFPTAATVPSPLSLLSPAGRSDRRGLCRSELQTPYVQQFNFGAQLELARNLALKLGTW